MKCQNLNIGITANLGLSKVTSNFLVSDDYKVKYTYSGNIGVFIEKEIGNKSSLGAEVLWVQIGGKETTDNKILTAFDGQDLKVVGIISDVAKLNSSYIAFPFYYRVQLNKIGIKIGLQTMFFLFANSSYEATGELNGKPYYGKSNTSGIKFDIIDFGPKIGVEYNLGMSLKLRADYYLGLPDITSDSSPFERKNRQGNLGINYRFNFKEKTSRKEISYDYN
ncbi:MAG: PorT family protein [Saprospiraceae bacterium]|nr:PorT family protein [Saprospiraceae bacterium]MBK9726521.1 PorT family protein [Saprospiraceae bacterium]